MFVQQKLMIWCVGSYDNIIEKYLWQSVGFSLFCGRIECLLLAQDLFVRTSGETK